MQALRLPNSLADALFFEGSGRGFHSCGDGWNNVGGFSFFWAMNETLPSLLEPARQAESCQLRLFSDVEIEAFERDEVFGHFTGERLFQQRPEVYNAVVQALAEGMGIRQIARAFKVSANTVMSVREREKVVIDTDKERTVANLRALARASSERLLDELESIPIDKLAITMGIAVEKLQLLEGNATARVEHVKPSAGIEAFNRIIDILPAETGLGAGTPVQKGDLTATSGLALESSSVPSEQSGAGCTNDEESVDLSKLSEVNSNADTKHAANSS